MGRTIAMLWHALFWVAAGVLYIFFVLPRWPELMGDTTHALGTALRMVTGALIGLGALPVAFTLVRTRKPEFGSPQLALWLRIGSIAAHVLAGVLIVGTAISEIWLSLNAAGPWLFGIYGAAAAVAVLGIFAFYLSFVAELPPPPPKGVKPTKESILRRLRRLRRKGDGEAHQKERAAEAAVGGAAEAPETAEAETTEAQEGQTPKPGEEAVAVGAYPHEPESSGDPEPTAEELPAADNAVATKAPRGGLRNRRPAGKASTQRRRGRARRGVALDD
ncbi:hypothetical protein MSM1_05320 [Mycobacterium sp. SM1]|uniref:hypothetical protein n=1 Tax=Mycobacterium sp. SM1 TaxID=2816243 RepID=UPI001BCB6BF9|nr:hypothetical protein [Mycobacterium sp. SM1]MBS4727790.1 hypothetical protein [Mycobacterium sp. SM1]